MARSSIPAGGLLFAVLFAYYAWTWLASSVKPPGGKLPPLAWQDVDGKHYAPADFSGHPATVLFFTSAVCPCADAYAPAVAMLARELTPQGIRFFAMFPNGDESDAEIRRYVADRRLGVPAVRDVGGVLAAHTKSTATPAVAILDSGRMLRFSGALGDVLKPGAVASKDDCRPFLAALEAVVAGQTVAKAGTMPVGCAVVGGTTAGLPAIEPNDNRQAAGRLENGVLTVRLVAETGVWRPERTDGPGLPMQAFREENRPLQSPAPLLRAPVGTEIRVTIRNALTDAPLAMKGLHERNGEFQPAATIPPGSEREFRWTVTSPGAYLYWGSTTQSLYKYPHEQDALLSGGLVLDEPGAAPDPDERIFVLHEYLQPAPDFTLENFSVLRGTLAINGLSWPYTERLAYDLGQRVRWRVINGSLFAHPMHLHGFHFDVTARSNGRREVRYAPEEREKSVTELVPSGGGSVSLEWTPHEAGRWLFHCHMAAHFSPRRRLRGIGKGPTAADEHTRHALENMAGLVLGVEVHPGAEAAPRPAPPPPREFTLHVREHPRSARDEPVHSFYVETDARVAPPELPTIPGPPLILTRGERARIAVVNHLSVPTAVHWHGIELASYFDGVVGWGGTSRSVTPSIAPGGRFDAEMAPPRAGTFIYHTHFNDDNQLGSGLYGALIVLEPGERFDPEKERIVVLSSEGENGGLWLNGSSTPPIMRMKLGETYRLRFINISLNRAELKVLLASGETAVRWRPVAKDGAALPPSRRVPTPAKQVVTVGETRDFEFTPGQRGELSLSATDPNGRSAVMLPVFVE
jgi:FtsP/CotA-like multicopper oxidase with cupredoxin domain